MPRVWLVTGASSSFGRAMTEHALSKGDKVLATLRNPSDLADLQAKHSEEQLRVAKLDVTAPSEVADAFRDAGAAFGRVDVVFNNAGRSLVGEVEATPVELARGLFETNFWGAVNVGNEALRVFREVNAPRGGLLLNVSSLVGLRGVPRAGYYSATKHALEGLTEAMVGELDPSWGIKVILVSPGAFRTTIREKRTWAPEHPAYAQEAGSQLLGTPGNLYPGGVGDVRKAVAKIFEVSLLQDPPLRLLLGKDAISTAREKIELLKRDTDAYESWSENIEEENA